MPLGREQRAIPVTLFAEPPLQAETMISSSMMVSLTLGLPDCTTKTSFSRTLVRIWTLVSPYRESRGGGDSQRTAPSSTESVHLWFWGPPTSSGLRIA